MSSPTRHQARRTRAVVLALALALGVLGPVPAPARAEQKGSSRLEEVGQLRLESPGFDPDKSSWLILDPAFRRGYVIVERPGATLIRSFNLDTLEYRRSAVVAGVPIVTDTGVEPGGGTSSSGEIMHAVDPGAHRLYLPLSATLGSMTAGSVLNFGSSDKKRMVSYVLVLDEKRFDEDPAKALGAFDFPTHQKRLADYPLMGMAVSRHHMGPKEPGKLLAAFASPYPITNMPITGTPIPGVYDHMLAQWDPSGIRADGPGPGNPLPGGVFVPPLAPVMEDWARTLEGCATAPLSSTGASGLSVLKTYQWGILPTSDAVYLGCQSAPQSGAVARVALKDGSALGTGMQVFPLAKPIGDVLVDPGERGRLFLRSFGGGTTWWVFDAAGHRYSGSIAATPLDTLSTATGVDPGSGRLWQLKPHTCAGGRPVRGGLYMAEGRLDPVPAAENVAPELASGAHWRIQVDPVARRLYVRRSGTVPGGASEIPYPFCDDSKRRPVPHERFYRVLEDRTPLVTRPPDLDDEAFTADTAEAPGLTQASYLGTGSGYGARLLLTGGVSAVTQSASDLGDATGGRSPCSKDDREVLAGSVGSVEVSDQSASASAAALDGDPRTRENLGYPLNRCRPQAPPPPGNLSPDQKKQWQDQADALNRCQDPDGNGKDDRSGDDTGTLDEPDALEETAFDEEAEGNPDANKDNCTDRTGANAYAATCLADEGERTAPGFRGGDVRDADPRAPKAKDVERRKAPRDGFSARTVCRGSTESAEASSTGALALRELDAAQGGARRGEVVLEGTDTSAVPDLPPGAADALAGLPAEPVRVAHSSSVVTVTRTLGKGVTVEVDSLARGIVIPGVGTIGAIRAEAVSVATGRRGGARGTYTRTVCGVDVTGLTQAGCRNDWDGLVRALNDALAGRGKVTLREPDPALMAGSEHGYLAAVARDRRERFGDTIISRDRSPALPALEITTYLGEGDKGAGRQILQLAGVEASTSYGVACLYGQVGTRCARADEEYASLPEPLPPEPGEPEVVTVVEEVTVEVPAEAALSDEGGAEAGGGGIVQRIVRVLKRAPEAAAEALRLLFNNPRELGLLAAVWALLYLPCWLGERRRSIGGLRARRAASIG